MSTGEVIGAIGGLLGGGAALYVGLRAPAIERLRARLQRLGAEHEIRFARLHERQVLVVDEMYLLAVRAERAMATWTHPLQEAGAPPPAELAQRAVDALNEFRTYVVEHRIWLDPDLAEQVAALDKKLIATAIEFQTYPAGDPRVAKERMETWYKVYKRMESDVPDLRKQIEDRFRRLLGVTEETYIPPRAANRRQNP